MLKPGWLADRLREDGVELTTLPLRGALDNRFRGELAGFLRERKPDVLHAHEFALTFYGRLAAGDGVGLVGTVHGKNFLDGFKRKLAWRTALQPARHRAFVAVSADLAEFLGRAQMPVIPNGIPLPGAPTAMRRERDAPLRLLAVGNLYPVKNHGLLVDAVAELIARGTLVELDILGRGGEEEVLRRRIAERGMDGRVRLQGFRSDVDAFLARTDVLVSSSLSEGLPLSFLEAMARGLPVVASAVGGVPELVEHERRGLLFDSGDLAGLVVALLQLAGNDELRLELGAAARRFVAERYSAAQMAERYLELYERVRHR